VPSGEENAAPTADATPAIPGAEPLEYMTQGRDVPESYRAPEPQQPPQPQFRVRDFSPEGRASGRRAAIPALIEPEPPVLPAELPTDLDYRTHAGPVAPVFAAPASDPENYPDPVRYIPSDEETDERAEAQDPQQVEQSAEADSASDAALTAEPAFASPVTSSPAFEEPVVVAEVIEEPAAVEDVQPEAPAVVASALPQDYPFLSRRELRARLAQEEAERAALLTGPQDQQDAGSDGQNDVEFIEHHEAELVDPEAEPAAEGDATSYTGSSGFEFPPPPQQSSLITGSLLTGPQPPAPTTASIPLPPPPPASASRVTDASAPAVDPNQSMFTAPSAFAAPPTPANVTPTFMEPDLEHTGSWEAPVGHWSRQADLDDENQPWENTVTREVGGGNVATTTSALVLPEMPLANPFPSALTGTGEILLTGSIDLPRSLSSGSGDSRHFDDTNVDLMYDTPDSEIGSADSAPVSAIRAVSTHTSARGVINSKKPQGNRMLTVLLVTASVMAAGVVVLLVAGLMGNVF